MMGLKTDKMKNWKLKMKIRMFEKEMLDLKNCEKTIFERNKLIGRRLEKLNWTKLCGKMKEEENKIEKRNWKGKKWMRNGNKNENWNEFWTEGTWEWRRRNCDGSEKKKKITEKTKKMEKGKKCNWGEMKKNSEKINGFSSDEKTKNVEQGEKERWRNWKLKKTGEGINGDEEKKWDPELRGW